jgi:hypothetical protein
METNYELKHKCLLVPLKAFLLVIVMVLVGFTTYAQQGKSVKVTNNQQLTEAMLDPSIRTVELAAGYYEYLDYTVALEATVKKGIEGDGARELLCQYLIVGDQQCFVVPSINIGDPDLPDPSYGARLFALATYDPGPCGGCPCPGPNEGIWTVTDSVVGSNIRWNGWPVKSNLENTIFWVDKPGKYIFRYTWAAFDSHVETEYYAFAPQELTLDAPDVCGTSTMVEFTLTPAGPQALPPPPAPPVYPFNYTVTWTLEGPLDQTTQLGPPPVVISGPQVSDDFLLSVDPCGLYKLSAIVYTRLGLTTPIFGCPDTISKYIQFYCEPFADPGPDQNVCNDLCVFLNGSTGLTAPYEQSPSYAFSWVQLSGPTDLNFIPDVYQEDVEVCRDVYPPVCSYGEYEVQLQVVNGLCYDDSTATLRFYEMPTAIAGPDQHLCNIFNFDLAAIPYDYCGDPGVNYWSHSWWTLEGQPDNCTVTFDVLNPTAPVAITNCDPAPACAYGEYIFVWHELNVKIDPVTGDTLWGESHCYSSDEVVVTIYEDPVPDAGDDLVLCDTWAFSLWGMGDEPCYQNTVVVYTWEKSAEPGSCTIQFSDLNDLNPDIVISNCDPASCPYGEYIFTLTQCNGYLNDAGGFVDVCCSSDDVSVWIFEPVDADAGPDQHICDNFAFTLTAVPTPFCGDAGVNYFTWGVWTQVSGPTMDVTIDDPTNFETAVTINDVSGCPYGDYQFKWTEYNGFGTPFQGCQGFDLVDIYIDEVPESIDAGPDQALCNTFEFALDGSVDMPCTDGTAYSIHWELYTQPDGCTVSINTPNDIDPVVSITNCITGECPFGEYEFIVTQYNGYYLGTTGQFIPVCEYSDTVSVWIFEPVDADAGTDQHLCNTDAFTLTAIPTDFCGVEGTNFFTAGEWVQIGGPKTATIDDPTEFETGVTIADMSGCPYGAYTFRWTEKNGFFTIGDVPFGYCEDYDDVTVYIYEQPEVNAGGDQAYCATDITFDGMMMFYLDGTVDPLCTDGWAYQTLWELDDQPGTCDVTFWYDNNIDPMVMIMNCAPCQYGEYKFKVTQYNGYYDNQGVFVPVCWNTDYVSVWIYEQPHDISAGPDQLLCNDYTFDLTGVGSPYCGDFGVNYNNWYSWVLVGQPAGASCDVTITNGDALTASVEVGPCTGPCPYGEFKFRFQEFNGTADVYCMAWDEVSVFIFEEPLADAGDDVNACVDIAYSPFCYDMTGSMDYCYSMYGTWTKSCGPGNVEFVDVNDPETEACFDQPGRYKFTWTSWNAAEDCEDSEEVIFDILEQPDANGGVSELAAPCDELCIDLGLAQITKYEYFGTEVGECPNFQDMAHWSYVDGPCSDPNSVTFADDTDPATELCVSYYGGYTVRWNEVNVAVDGLSECSSFFDVFVEFYETPTPNAGPDDAICGNCYTIEGEAYQYEGGCNQHQNDFIYWESLPTNSCAVTFDPPTGSAVTEVCIPDDAACYGTYGFVLHQSNGDCVGTDTVYICFSQIPGDIPVCFWNNPNWCGEFNGPDFIHAGCLFPDQVLEVCAEGTTEIQVNPWCNCPSWFDFSNPEFWGWTFEWSLISPAGTITQSQAGYFDFEAGSWIYPYIYINWGECCDTARLYLTINSGIGECGIACENTMEYKFFVYHKPCVNIVGPDVSEVGMLTQYCNDCPPNPCLLYDWTAEHCGHIVDGQGTPCIDVLWDSYNINGGWGQITLTVFDTCTGCCNYDEMPVKIYPTGTLGDATLSGHVYYHNNGNTPLNGVEIQLWNGGIPVQTTTSFNDIEGGNGVGYYEFVGVNGTTNFGITASYGAPWYGANATDALAVELKTIGALPITFLDDALVGEAMDVNNINGINGTDALWIKQRAISMVNFFPAGDWAFWPGMSSTAGTYNILTLNMGDANRSNIPASMKTTPAIDLVNDGTMNVVTGQVFELPIRLAKADQFGAITLNLGYNSALLEVVDVNPVEGMLSNVSNGNVSIAWSNTNPMVLADNDVVLTLKVKAIGPITATESMFSIGMGSEFANPTANVIEPVTLKTYGITTAAAAEDYFLSTNRPNPFSTSTFIEYTMPETGKVKLSVLDMLGQEIAVLVDATQTAGSYQVEFSAAGLATGVYIYKITVDGETRDFISTQRMVISH